MAALDLSSLLKRPANAAVKPQALPPGDYSGIIKSFEYGNQNKNNTPYVRLQVGLMDWPEAVTAEDRGQMDGEGKFIPTDLSKRSMRRDMFLTDDAFWRLTELCKSCGLDVGSPYDELIPQLVGQRVTVEVKQYVNQQTSEIGNDIGKMVGGA
jgi:hypothetical protein